MKQGMKLKIGIGLFREKEAFQMTKELCVSWGYSIEDFPAPDRMLKEGDKISIGKYLLTVMHTPGHTPGSICLYGENTLFTGDTLFRRSVGRTDFPGGDEKKLFNSLKKIILLPPDTIVLCGHGNKTTIAEEIINNPFIAEVSTDRI